MVFNEVKQLINAERIDFPKLIVFCMVGIKRDHYEYVVSKRIVSLVTIKEVFNFFERFTFCFGHEEKHCKSPNAAYSCE